MLVPPRRRTHKVATTALPRGTVTFLFTDIEGSTERWEQCWGLVRLVRPARPCASGRHPPRRCCR
jgi:class 3 adenylate cyclase